MLNVKECDYQDGGKKCVYTMTNQSTVIEVPEYPGKSRLRFYDVRGYAICKGVVKQEMKAAVDRWKAKWRLAK